MAFVFDLGKVFEDYMAKNEKTWVHDRSSTLGASEVFRCQRQNWFDKRGKEFGFAKDPDYKMDWGPTERGNLIENNFVVPAMKHLPKGIELLYGGEEQHTFVSGRNSSTPDGLFTGIPVGDVTIKYRDIEIPLGHVGEGCIGLEIKSIDPRANLVEERAKHRGQSQIGLWLIGEKTEWKPRFWVILYVNASFLSEITPFVVTYNPEVAEAAQMRSAEIWEATDPMQLMPEGKFDGDCQYCAYTVACGEAIMKTIANGSNMKIDNPFVASELENILARYADAKTANDEINKEFELAKQAVKDFLAIHQLNKASNDQFSVSWSRTKGRTTADLKAMAADGIDISKYEKTGLPFDTLKITPRRTTNVE